MNRHTNFTAIIGTNDTGKSTIGEILLKKWKESFNLSTQGQPVPENYGRVFAFDYQERFESLAGDKYTKIYVDSDDDYPWLDDVLQSRQSILLVDDFRYLFPNDRTPRKLLELLMKRAELGIEIVFICHSPTHLLSRCVHFITDFFVFNTVSNKKDFKNRFPNDDDAYIIKELMDEQLMGVSSDEYKFRYPNFPFVHYHSQSRKITPVNFINKKEENEFIRSYSEGERKDTDAKDVDSIQDGKQVGTRPDRLGGTNLSNL